jgi:hypothetical protein
MHALIRTWIVCVGVAYTSVALAAPRVDAGTLSTVYAIADLSVRF